MDPNIEQLTDERDVLEAQRDHYRDRCTDLANELNECKKLLQGKFQTSQWGTNPSIFSNESLERLWEWQKCLNYCVEEEIERLKPKGKLLSDEIGDKKDSREGSSRVNGSQRDSGTELPFSPGNLASFLTKNHQLTQGRTQYLEPRPKNG